MKERIDSFMDIARRPLALLAATAALAAGVALETPAIASAHADGSQPALSEGHLQGSPQAEQNHDAKNWPLAVAALVGTFAVGMGAILVNFPKTEQNR